MNKFYIVYFNEYEDYRYAIDYTIVYITSSHKEALDKCNELNKKGTYTYNVDEYINGTEMSVASYFEG